MGETNCSSTEEQEDIAKGMYISIFQLKKKSIINESL